MPAASRAHDVDSSLLCVEAAPVLQRDHGDLMGPVDRATILHHLSLVVDPC